MGREWSRQHGGGWGGAYGAHLPLDAFDAMPWPVREVFCLAAYNYTPAEAFDLVVAGRSVEWIVRDLRRRMRLQMQREVLRLYGPTHPQAPAS